MKFFNRHVLALLPLWANKVSPFGLSSLRRKNSIAGIDPALITKPDWFRHFNHDPDTDNTLLLDAMSKATIKKLSPTVDAIVLGQSGFDVTDISSDTIFVRDFYPALLKTIRKTNSVVLLGNPGVGKSYFQQYYLARIMNPALLGDLPPDCFGSCDPPKIVIRQLGNEEMTIYDIQNRKAESLQGSSLGVLECFDPKTSLYLFEPEKSHTEPHYEGLLLPTLATVSPDRRRYKQFCKNGGAVKLYMPLFTLEELLAIGKWILDSGSIVNSDLRALYSPELIKERYSQFGGIIRHVLPRSIDVLTAARKDMSAAIFKCDAKALLLCGDPEDPDVSDFVMQYDVEQNGKEAFNTFGLKYTNDNICDRLEGKLLAQSTLDKITALMKNDKEPSFMQDSCSQLYESVIFQYLSSLNGVYWLKRVSNTSIAGEKSGKKQDKVIWESFSESFEEKVEGKIPHYKDMKDNVLYVSLKKTFPFVKAVAKQKDGGLVGFQVTRQRGKLQKYEDSTIKSFMDEIGLQDLTNFTFVLIHKPRLADTSKLHLSTSNSAYAEQLRTHVVWKVPTDYKHVSKK